MIFCLILQDAKRRKSADLPNCRGSRNCQGLVHGSLLLREGEIQSRTPTSVMFCRQASERTAQVQETRPTPSYRAVPLKCSTWDTLNTCPSQCACCHRPQALACPFRIRVVGCAQRSSILECSCGQTAGSGSSPWRRPWLPWTICSSTILDEPLHGASHRY